MPSCVASARWSPVRKSNLTIRTAGMFFLVSAFFEGLSLTSGIPLFGAIRGGAIAVVYHLLYIGLFLAMGIGLWAARPWGYRVMFVGTIVYSLDKVMYLLDRQARDAAVREMLAGYRGMLDIVDPSSMQQMMNLLTVLMVVSWWGFLLYLYFRQSYFEAQAE